MAQTLVQRLMELGTPFVPANELVKQINSGTYNVTRLINAGWVEDLARYLAVSIASGTFKATKAVEYSMVPAVATLIAGAGVPVASLAQMVTVCCGNSISAQNKYSTYIPTNAELHLANALAGAPMRFPRITPSTRTDRYGIHGYSGQELDTINNDLAAQWEAPLDAAGVTPDLWVGLALIENDIANGVATEIIKDRVDAFIAGRRAKWPTARGMLGTPRPSLSYNTGPKVATYQAIRAHMLAKEDGRNIFIARMDSYEDEADPGRPRVTNITGSISGTVLTVTATNGPIRKGAKIQGAGVIITSITSLGTGRGGTGTYNIGTSQTVASQQIIVSRETDESVHPNAAGALMNARNMATTMRRIALSFVNPFAVDSSNRTLTGSVAASGTNVSGTVPTSCAITGNASALYVGAALQPGMQETISALATVVGSGVAVDTGTASFGSKAMVPVQASPYAVVELISGAANLSFPALRPRIADGGGNNFQKYFTQQTPDVEPDWLDGDILTLECPPLIAASGSISAIQNYFTAVPKLNQDGGGSLSFKVLEQGVRLVS